MSQTEPEARWVVSGRSIERYHTNKDCRVLAYADNVNRLTDARDETRDVRECRVCAGEWDGGGGGMDRSLTCPHCGASINTPQHIKSCDGTPQVWRDGPVFHTRGGCPERSDDAQPAIQKRTREELEPCGVCYQANPEVRAEWPDGGEE